MLCCYVRDVVRPDLTKVSVCSECLLQHEVLLHVAQAKLCLVCEVPSAPTCALLAGTHGAVTHEGLILCSSESVLVELCSLSLQRIWASRSADSTEV